MSPQRTRFRAVFFTPTAGPRVLFATGWVLFWLADAAGRALPAEAMLVGPGVMLAGIILDRRRASRKF